MSSIRTMGGKRRWHWSSSTSTSTSLSTTDSLSQIKEMASQLSLRPHIHNFFRDNVTEDGMSAFRFECNEKTLRELGEVVAALQPLAIAKGCREAVALALCALPCGNHFTSLWIDGATRNSGTEPFLALLADSNTCGLKELRIGNLSPHLGPSDWLSREAEWKLLVHLILHNTTLKSLRLQGCLDKMNQEGGIALAHSIQKNRGLEDLTIWATDAFEKEGGGLALAAMVRHNSTLRTLDLQRVPLSSRGTDALAKALAANQGLRELRLRGTYLGWTPVTAGRAIVRELSLAAAVPGPSTCTLESLELEVDPPAADAMILVLSGTSCANFCRSLQKLVLIVRRPADRITVDGMDASAVTNMIRSNQKLVSFTLHGATYSSIQWAESILRALESNATLRDLRFSDCHGVDAELAYNALIRMLSINTTLHSIDLAGTPLQEAGRAEAVEDELRQNREYRANLAALPKIKVKSCRLVLCGNAYAGKTTLCSTMLRLQPGRTRFQVPQDQRDPQQDMQEQERTRGFEVNLLMDEDNLRVALWDFSGQPFYYALHDSVFPIVNGSTILLFTFSPLKDVVHPLCHLDQLTPHHLKSMQDFEDEFKYWLRFVSSNSRPRPSLPLLPSVLVVITFQDCSAQLLASTYPEVEFQQKVEDLQAEFQGFVRILGQPEFLDARSETHVQPFLERLRERFVSLVSELPPVPTVCEKTRLRLEGCCSEHDNSPLMSIQDFKQVIQDVCAAEIEEPTLSLEERKQMIIFKSLVDKNWTVVALYLHATGEVIYLDGLMDFMVVNPRWLGQGVMGHLVEEFSPYDHLNRRKLKFHEKKRGFVTTQGLKDLLEASLRKVGLPTTGVTTDKLIQLLCNLHLCYGKKDEHGRDGYFIPVLFAEDKGQLLDRQLEWPSQIKDTENNVFFGARLQCANIIQTFLTPGFFPRIQVLLCDAGKEKGWNEAGMKLGVHLYGISTSGYDVLLEYNDVNFHIDMLVRSCIRDHFLSRSFLYQHFIKPIRTFCASQEGCVGVYLIEGVLRQECVQRLTLCRYRTKQCVFKDELKSNVLGSAKGHFHVHHWYAVEDQKEDHNSGILEAKRNILEAKVEYATLLKKSNMRTMSKEDDVDDIPILGSQNEIQVLITSAQAHPSIIPSITRTMPFKHISLSTKDVSLWRRGIAKLKFGRVIPLKVHLGCECQDNAHGHDVNVLHDVVSQPGRLLYLTDERARKMHDVYQWILWILCLGCKVGVQQATHGFVAGGDAVANMPLIPIAVSDVTLEFVANRMNAKGSPSLAEELRHMSTEELRKRYETYLARNANEWKEYYFRRNDALDRFKREFMLQQVEYASNGQTLWICNACLNKMGNEDGYVIV